MLYIQFNPCKLPQLHKKTSNFERLEASQNHLLCRESDPPQKSRSAAITERVPRQCPLNRGICAGARLPRWVGGLATRPFCTKGRNCGARGSRRPFVCGRGAPRAKKGARAKRPNHNDRALGRSDHPRFGLSFPGRDRLPGVTEGGSERRVATKTGRTARRLGSPLLARPKRSRALSVAIVNFAFLPLTRNGAGGRPCDSVFSGKSF